MEFGGTLEGFGRRSSGTAGAFGTLRGVLGLWGEVAGAGPRRGRGLGRVEGRGRRARARRRRAPSRPPCWLVCGCQTEPDAAAAAAAAAPQAPVAPASPALPAAAAAHPGRLGGVEVSRGRRASGGGSGAPGRGPSPPQGTDSLTAPLPSSQPPRACTQVPQLGPTQVGPLSFPPGPAPRAGAWPPPHLDPSFRCKDPPPPIFLSGSSSFYILRSLGLSSYSHPRSRILLRPSSSTFQLGTTPPHLPRALSSPPPARRLFPPEPSAICLPPPCTAQPLFPPGIGGGVLSVLGSGPVPPRLRAGAGPFSLPRDQVLPPHPRPPQHSGDGGGRAWFQLPFVPRGMAETPPDGPVRLIRVGEWVRGGRPLQGDPSSLCLWGGSP